jgi:hypothetical protein
MFTNVKLLTGLLSCVDSPFHLVSAADCANDSNFSPLPIKERTPCPLVLLSHMDSEHGPCESSKGGLKMTLSVSASSLDTLTFTMRTDEATNQT